MFMFCSIRLPPVFVECHAPARRRAWAAVPSSERQSLLRHHARIGVCERDLLLAQPQELRWRHAGRRLLSSAEIFSFEGSYRASALDAGVPGLHLLVVCRGGQLFAQLQESAEPLQSYRLVAVLRAPVSGDDSDARRLVHGPHATRRLVLVLATRSAGAERHEAHVRRVKCGGPDRPRLELEDADEPVLALVVGPQRAARYPED